MFRADVVSKENCCFNNNIMNAAGSVQMGCRVAQPYGGIVQLPAPMDEGGYLREVLPLIDGADILRLQALGRHALNCTILTKAEVPSDATVQRYEPKLARGGIALRWFYAAIKLPPRLEQAYSRCAQFPAGTYTAVHLRIERDWWAYCQMRTKREGVQACVDLTRVAGAIVNSTEVATTHNYVLIYGSDRRTKRMRPAAEFKAYDRNAQVHHRTPDCASPNVLSYNENALLDIWLARNALNFVGVLSSTFSNGVTIMRNLYNRSQNYAYSCPHISPLVGRHDLGELGEGHSDRVACACANSRSCAAKRAEGYWSADTFGLVSPASAMRPLSAALPRPAALKAINCTTAVRPMAASPVRSPQAVHDVLAGQLAGLEVVEIGTRHGDGLECFSRVAKSAVAVDVDAEHCRSLGKRSDAQRQRGNPGFSVSCEGYERKLPDADIYTWWQQDGADLRNALLLAHLRQEQLTGRIRTSAQAFVLFDLGRRTDKPSWQKLRALATWKQRVQFDEHYLCTRTMRYSHVTCKARARGQFIIAKIPIHNYTSPAQLRRTVLRSQ